MNPRTHEPYVSIRHYSVTKKNVETLHNVMRILEHKQGKKKWNTFWERESVRDLIMETLLPRWVQQHRDILVEEWRKDQIKPPTGRKPKVTLN